MRRRITLLAALVVLGGCSQDDQDLPFESQPSKPVTSTMGSGNTTVSSPDGISLTVPAGALPAGTRITVAKLDRTAAEELPGAVGDVYLVGFDNVPTSDPSISFSSTLGQGVTAGQLVGMVPVVMRVASPGAPAGNLTTSRSVAHQRVRAEVASTTAEEKFEALKAAGIFDGVDGGASIQDDMTRAQFGRISALLAGLDATLESPPVFSAVPPASWYTEYIEAAKGVGLLSGLGFDQSYSVLRDLTFSFDFPFANVGATRDDLVSTAYAYVVADFLPSTLPTYEILATPWRGTTSSPLIPSGSSSASFSLLCTAIQWPDASEIPTCSENTIDVRVSPELLSRFATSVVVPNYLQATVTLLSNGTATGEVKYETYLRSALSSGITGVGRKGDLDLNGSWSAAGDTITIGGHDFLYSTPDDSSLVLSVSDSVKLENNDGSESWEPVKVNVKLTRK